MKFYKKKFPELFNSFLSSKKGYKLSKKELGYENLKKKKELKKLLSINSIYKNNFAKIYSKVYDFINGSGIRTGENLSKNQLNKYISKARNNR